MRYCYVINDYCAAKDCPDRKEISPWREINMQTVVTSVPIGFSPDTGISSGTKAVGALNA